MMLKRAMNFVPASKETNGSEKEKEMIDGKEIRKFYEQVTKMPSQLTNLAARRIKVVKAATSLVVTKRKVSAAEFLRAAQNDDVKLLKDFVANGSDVNVKDDFGWTALMCAAANGSRNAVKFLVANGADKNIRDKKGMNAREIAKKTGNGDVWRGMTSERTKTKTKTKTKEETTEKFVREIWCEACEQRFRQCRPNEHLASTLHNFNTMTLKPGSDFRISHNNKGYQLMLKKGWSEGGLGPREDGIRVPVKTVLKRDRKGLGLDSKVKSRVTHFAAGDERAVKRVGQKEVDEPKTLKAIEKEMRTARAKEIKWRRMFNE